MTTHKRLRSAIGAAARLDDPDITAETINGIRQYTNVLLSSVESAGDEPDGVLSSLVYSTFCMCDAMTARDDVWNPEWAETRYKQALSDWKDDRIAAELKLYGRVSATTVFALEKACGPIDGDIPRAEHVEKTKTSLFEFGLGWDPASQSPTEVPF